MSTDSYTAEKASGRPRNPHISESAIAAALELLDEQGYSEVTFEAVARRAGTSRPAIYRRWSSRPALVLSALTAVLAVPEQPDTGCTLCDIEESFQVFVAAYRRIRPEVLSALYADCAADPDLRQRYVDTIVEPARTAVGDTLQRAKARGDLRQDSDDELLLDLVGALVHYRAMFRPEHISDSEAERAVEMLLQGAARDYPALVAHSEALEQEHLHTV